MEMSSHSTSLSRSVRFSCDLTRSDDQGESPIHTFNLLQLARFAQWTIEVPDPKELSGVDGRGVLIIMTKASSRGGLQEEVGLE